MKTFFILFFTFSVFIQAQNYKNYTGFKTRIEQLIKAKKYQECVELIGTEKPDFPEHWFSVSKDEIYCNEKLGLYEKNLDIFSEGHKRGYFWLIHPQLPGNKPYLGFDRFQEISKTDMDLRSKATESSETVFKTILPEKTDPEIKYPMVLVFHGGGSNFEQVMGHWLTPGIGNSIIKTYFQSYRHYDSETYGWSSDDTRGFREIRGIFDTIVKTYPVDTSRVILAGISAGATFSLALALKNIIPVSGLYLLCPGKPVFFEQQSGGPFNKSFHVAMISGETDFYSRQQEELKIIFDSLGIRYTHQILPDTGHEYPKNETALFESAIIKLLNLNNKIPD